MSKPEPCPFCGDTPEFAKMPHKAYHGTHVIHYNEKCILSGIKFPTEQWKRRPIEDKLKEEIDDLKEFY